VYYLRNRDIHKLFMIKKIKKNKKKKREKVGNKRGGRKIKERKRNLSKGKKSPSSNKLL
jgi:hypothetical protein